MQFLALSIQLAVFDFSMDDLQDQDVKLKLLSGMLLIL